MKNLIKISAQVNYMDEPNAEHIKKYLTAIERNIELVGADKITRDGFTQVPNFLFNEEVGISPLACWVYSKLLSYAWHNDKAFPGQARMAKDLRMSQPAVSRYVKELEKAGLIEIQRRGQGKTNVYRLLLTVKKKNEGQN